MKYSKIFLEHFYSPQNVGIFADSEEGVGRAEVGSFDNGAIVQFQIKAANEIIVASKFRAYGASPIIAACSYATMWLQNKSLSQAKLLTNVDLMTALDIPELQMHCSLLVEDAIKKAIDDLERITIVD